MVGAWVVEKFGLSPWADTVKWSFGATAYTHHWCVKGSFKLRSVSQQDVKVDFLNKHRWVCVLLSEKYHLSQAEQAYYHIYTRNLSPFKSRVFTENWASDPSLQVGQWSTGLAVPQLLRYPTALPCLPGMLDPTTPRDYCNRYHK